METNKKINLSAIMNSNTVQNNKDGQDTTKAQSMDTEEVIINNSENIDNNPDTKDVPIITEENSIISESKNSTDNKEKSDITKVPIVKDEETLTSESKKSTDDKEKPDTTKVPIVKNEETLTSESKNSTDDKEKPDITKVPIAKDEETLTSESKNSTDDKEKPDITKVPIVKEVKSKSFISINDIKKTSKDKDRKEDKEKANDTIEKLAKLQEKEAGENQKKGNKKELFTNYKANYKDKKFSLIQQIKKLKYIPKTNYKFLSGIVVFTVLVVGGLFILDPEDHSIQNYKASILNIMYKDEIEQKRLDIENEYQRLQEELKWRVEYTKYLGFNFTIESRTVNGEKSYKYKNTIYNTKEELDKVLALEVKKIKNGIIKDVLINSFK